MPKFYSRSKRRSGYNELTIIKKANIKVLSYLNELRESDMGSCGFDLLPFLDNFHIVKWTNNWRPRISTYLVSVSNYELVDQLTTTDSSESGGDN
uniref:Uncharacterized protein n=1 Tax=Tetranychus urticae TaxID=32264 RepID=T1KUI1_TETUR